MYVVIQGISALLLRYAWASRCPIDVYILSLCAEVLFIVRNASTEAVDDVHMIQVPHTYFSPDQTSDYLGRRRRIFLSD